MSPLQHAIKIVRRRRNCLICTALQCVFRMQRARLLTIRQRPRRSHFAQLIRWQQWRSINTVVQVPASSCSSRFHSNRCRPPPSSEVSGMSRAFPRWLQTGTSAEYENSFLEMGGWRIRVEQPKRPDLVPRLVYGAKSDANSVSDAARAAMLGSCPEIQAHLQFLLQKDALGQDAMLLGPPGPLRRWVVLAYCALAGREVEYVALSRDSGEAELKQRRELRSPLSAAMYTSDEPNRHSLSAVFVDGPIVRAAREGRILVLDGVEKAERNILPILNNLLENREMGLEDGTRLLNSTRFDQIAAPLLESRGLTGISTESMEVADMMRQEFGLIRVHPRFRVFALGLPVPQYPGNALDPPLRSRFQGRYVSAASRSSLSSIPRAIFDEDELGDDTGAARLSDDALTRLVRFASTLNLLHDSNIPDSELDKSNSANALSGGYADELSMSAIGRKPWRDFRRGNHRKRHGSDSSSHAALSSFVKPPPHVPLMGLLAAGRAALILSADRNSMIIADLLLTQSTLNSMYPVALLSSEIDHRQMATTARENSIGEVSSGDASVDVLAGTDGSSLLRFRVSGSELGAGRAYDIRWIGKRPGKRFEKYVKISQSETEHAVAGMCLDLAVSCSHVLLCGPHGSGKMTSVRQACELLGSDTEILTCFRDMSSRDLFQRRTTDEHGNTSWADSPLIKAARQGAVCILQNVDRLPVGTLSVLASLLQDAETSLPDGSRLIAANRYDTFDTSDKNVSETWGRIHPRFRVVATAAHSLHRNSGESKSQAAKWLTEEVVNMFGSIRTIDAASGPVLHELLIQKTGCSGNVASILVSIDAELRKLCAQDVDAARALLGKRSGQARGSSTPLSSRQMCRIAAASKSEASSVGTNVHRVLLAHMMPHHARALIERALSAAGCRKEKLATSVPLNDVGDFWKNHPASRALSERPEDAALIPCVTFFDIPAHGAVLRRLADEFARGEHLLLIGAQGTGKNKLTDSLCERLRLPRQYMQLHRDTTVAQLTTQLGIQQGRIVRRDSPLLIAARCGQVLVVDEADKAPLEVVAILRALVDGEVSLADGRKLISHSLYRENRSQADEDVIVMHPEFRLVVLANRPGFPFMGNDFFGECGDAFSPFLVENPDNQSEVELLGCYAPTVPSSILRRIAGAFSSLREAAERGELKYPYSTREAVSVVKHLESLHARFPEGDIDLQVSESLDNVLAFDTAERENAVVLTTTFASHGLPVGGQLARNAYLFAGSAQSTKEYPSWANALANLLAKQRIAFKPGESASQDRIRYVWGPGMKSNVNQSFGSDNHRRAPWHAAPPLRNALTGPKHGKLDPQNSPHVGGNTWAGGTGGRDTAGLGGVGGPYRLDAGHEVHQISDTEKRALAQNEADKEAARKMGQEAFARRLAAIEMDEDDAKIYAAVRARVAPHIAQLRSVINDMESRSHERQWMRHQLDGELDDAKVVESLSGESAVFKRRVSPSQEDSPDFRSKDERDRDGRKLIHFIVDVSASMYRFEGYDHRLTRLRESTLLLLEGLDGFDDKVSYAMTGHSGDSPDIKFIDWDKPPRNEQERFRVLQLMTAHAQHCWSGDHTLMALQQSVDRLHRLGQNDESGDASNHDKFVVLMSDANLDRYGISAKELKTIMTKRAGVHAHVFFIGSLHNQAENLVAALPTGAAYAVRNTAELPSLLRKVVENALQ